MKMIPSNAIAAVASSADRNCGDVRTGQWVCHFLGTHLDEGITFLIIALHGQNRVARATSADVHLCHLLVEEVGQVLLVNICGDTSDVQSA